MQTFENAKRIVLFFFCSTTCVIARAEFISLPRLKYKITDLCWICQELIASITFDTCSRVSSLPPPDGQRVPPQVG